MPIVIEHIPAPTDDARALVDELEAELSASYSADQRHGFDITRLFQPNILFFISRLDGNAVGCGGIAFQDGLAELKRMYVRPRARRQKIAKAILSRLEQEARTRGYDRVVLETGDVLHAALRFYTAAGFTPCLPFGAYLEMPPASIQRSVFLEKVI